MSYITVAKAKQDARKAFFKELGTTATGFKRMQKAIEVLMKERRLTDNLIEVACEDDYLGANLAAVTIRHHRMDHKSITDPFEPNNQSKC